MSSSIIISGSYQGLLANEIVKSKYGEYTNDDIMFPYNSFDVQYDILLDKNKVQDLLQMYLIYDKIILSDLSPEYNLNELVQLGEIEYDTYETSRNKLGFTKFLPEIDYIYAQYLKPLIVDFYGKRSKIYFSNTKDMSNKECFSCAYDYFYPNKNDKENMDKNIILFNRLLAENVQSYRRIRMKNNHYNISDPIKEYTYELISVFASAIETLTWQFEISGNHNCPIMQDTFDFNKISYIGNEEKSKTYEAYILLKMECKNIFGELPYLQSFDETIKLKHERKKELKDLREVLKGLECTLKKEGREAAVIQAAQDIHKASKALNKRHPGCKVMKWTQYLAVPIGFAEVYLNLPPYIGLTVEAIGQLGEALLENAGNKNNWIELFRH